ncbi:N-alpha-acetyltransferase auxiliary subunit [Acrasis kona]|uniref:N-alpha-acetyltransferase auxiliary subunit n=1 Tax=Acrasis kona TaxID=1008807 RepID=A0AAW2YGP1_9EUKA
MTSDDEWSYWLGYISTLIELSSTNTSEFRVGEWNGKKMNFHRTIAEGLDFMHKMQSRQDSQKRGPFLAELELTHRTSTSEEKIVIPSLLSTYFVKFCNKSIGYQDMKPYLVHATPTFLSQLVIPVQDPFQQIPYKINQRKMQRHLDQPLDVQQLIQEYQDALPFGTKLVKTENQYGDDFLLLAAHVLIDQSRHHDAILLLEYGLAKSSYNFQFKCLLIRLYSVLGASGGQRIFQTFMTGLELKHIQWETLSHLIWNELGAYGNYKKQKQVNDKILEFYFGEHLKDTPELTALPYRTGAYSKIDEFVKFKHRLDRSHQVHQSQIQMAYLELVRMRSNHFASDISEFLKTALDTFDQSSSSSSLEYVCNHDMSVLLHFDKPTIQSLQVSTLVDKQWILSKYNLLKLIQHAAALVDSYVALTTVPKKPKKKNKQEQQVDHAQLARQQLATDYSRLQSLLFEASTPISQHLHCITMALYDMVMTDQSLDIDRHIEGIQQIIQQLQLPTLLMELVDVLEKVVIPFDTCVSLWAQLMRKYKGTVDCSSIKLKLNQAKTILLQKLEDSNVHLKQYQKADHVSDKLNPLLVQGDDAWTKLFESNKNVLNGSIQSAYTSVELLVNDAVENLKTNSE